MTHDGLGSNQRLRARPAGGFSLIELLVVVSIVVVLAGLLLPAVQLVKRSAQSVGCMSNLRQQGVALTCYGQDNGGVVLPLVGGTAHSPWEDMGQLHLLSVGGYIEIPGCDNLADPVTATPSIVRCPAGRSSGIAAAATGPDDPQLLNPGRWTVVDLPAGAHKYYDSWYTWNAAFLKRWTGWYLLCDKATFNSIPNLATAVFIVDGNTALHPNYTRISARHGGRINILLGDGHVAAATAAELTDPTTHDLVNRPDFRWVW